MRGILEGIRYFFATSRAARIVLASVLGVSAVGAGGAGIYAIMNDNIEPEVVEEVQVDEEAGAEDVYIPEFKSVVLTSESLEKDLTIYISDKEDNAVTGVPFQVKLLKPETAETLQTYIDAIDGVNAQIAEMVSPEDDLTSVLENRNVDITITDENGEVVETQKGRIKDDPLYQLYLDKEEAIQSFAMAVKDAEGNVYTDEDEDGVIAEKDMEPGDYVACLLYDFDNTEIYDPAEYATAVNVKNKVEYKVQKEITKQIKKDVAAEDAKPKAAPVENVLKDTVEYVESRRVENGAKAVAVAGGDVVAPKSTAKSSKHALKDKGRTSVEHALKKDVDKFKITINYELLDKEGKVVATVPVEKDKEYAKGAKIEHKAPDEYKYNEKTYVKKSGPEPAFDATVTKAATYKFIYQIKAEATPTPTPTEKPSATPSPTPTEKPSTSPTPTPEATPTPTPTPEATPTPTPTPTPEATPTSTEDAAKARGVKRPLAVSFNANRLNTMLFATRVKRIAANDNSIEKVTLDMSYKEGVFTITATGSGKSEIVDVKVNGTAVTMKDGKGTFTATGDGDYKLTGTPKWSDGQTATDNETLYVVYTVSGFGTASGERLKDKAGNELFLDEGLSKPATAADYNKDKTYYYKSATYTYYGWQSIDGATYYFDKNANKVTGEQVIQGVKYNFGPDGALLVKGNGIDVSKYQGKIDWNQAKSAVSFAIIRCGYRGQTDGQLHEDPYFYQNMKGAKAAGVATGIYIFSRAVNEAEAVQEASMAVAMANKAGGCAYPIFIDMEDTARGGGLSGAQRTAIANAFIATVQSSGYKAGVYCSKNWMLQRMEAGGINGSAYIWIAQYNTSCTYSGKYSIWQYSSSGSVPGIKGRVDMNKSFF